MIALLVGPFPRLHAEEDLGPLDADVARQVSSKSLSGYEGMPLPVVEKMLELARVRPGERVYDLGSGDGRVVIMAAQRFDALGVGIELDPRLSRKSLEKIWDLNLAGRVQIIEGDLLDQDLSSADVVTIHLTPYALGMLKPHLEKYLHDGLRIVVCENEVPDWKPATTLTATGDNNRVYKLRLYVISKSRSMTSFSNFGRSH